MGQSKVFKGAIWASIQKFGNLGISFISNMILARLLTPDDFGTVGMLMFFLAIAQTIVDGGFGAALIQKKEISKEDVNTVFYINMGMSILAYSALFFFSPYIADFYNIPILSPLLRVQGLVIIIQGGAIIQTILLQKNFDFKKLSICNLLGSLGIAISGICAALLGFGVWSLVIRTIVGALITSLLLWWMSKWHPNIIFSKDSFRNLFGFGGFMLLSSLMISVSNNIQTMILGKLFRPSTVGNFSQAKTLRNIPSDCISSVIGQVLYPDFSNHQDNDELIKQKLEKSIYIISYATTFILCLCILEAKPLINIIYGNQWIESIPYFQLLCIGGIPLCLQDININVIKAKGHSFSLFICNLVKIILYIILMIIGANYFGIYGFLLVMVGYSFLAYITFAIIGTHFINTTILGQIKQVGKSLTLALIPMCIIYCMRLYIDEYPNNTVWLCSESIIYITLFVFISKSTHCYAFSYLYYNLIRRN